MTVVKISQKIVGLEVASAQKPDEKPPAEVMNEKVKRPALLQGTTYKIKTPLSEHAIYVTINDIQLNGDTPRPFEMFINSKNMDHFAWSVSLTRMMSAVFRKGGDVAFIVDELRCVHDPKGGFWSKGRYVPSLPAAIGDVLAQHLIGLGLYQAPQKAAEFHQTVEHKAPGSTCPQCGNASLRMESGCESCSECDYSKCG
jgi:ribonucleoside-diphosphate reductase alpha chain